MKLESATSTVVDPEPTDPDQLAEFLRQVHVYVTSHHGGADADDVTQETVIQAWQQELIRRESLDDRVFSDADRIALSNRITDIERPRTRELPESPEECVIAKVEHDIIRSAVRTEKPTFKTILVSRFWRGESYTEYSQREGITEEAARQRNHRALESVRRKFERACRVVIPLTAVLAFIRQLGARASHASTTATAGTTPLAVAAGLGLVIAVSGDDVPASRSGESPHRTASESDATGPAVVDFLCSGSTSRCPQASPPNVDP